MSESSTEKAGEPVAPQQNKVPVEAIAKERAEKREARAEVETLKQELAAKQKQTDTEMAALIESLGPYVADMVAKATETALKPVKDEADLLKTAIKHGLNEDQAAALAKLKAETPGLTDARALTILRAEMPEQFKQPAQTRQAPVTGFIPSGPSQARNEGTDQDFLAKMLEAKKSGNGAEAQRFATLELHRRVAALRGKL